MKKKLLIEQCNWEELLKGEKIITEKEARELHKIIKEIRKERGFRL